MNNIFEILSDYTFQIVAFGSGMLGIISGIVGCLIVLRKQSLLGDAVSHSSLPGIALAFLLTGVKDTNILLLGALISGLLATFLIINIVKYSKIKFDGSLALIMSVFFGLGLVLLTYIQKTPNANQAGLNRFIFGQASTILTADIITIIILGTIMLLLLILFWKELKVYIFDSEYAKSIGFNIKFINFILSVMTVSSIIIGLQTVGAILMSSMLIAPGVAARQWTNKLWLMVVLAGIFGAISGIGGTLVSSSISKMPTGPVIIVIMSIIVIISILVSPGRGILWRKRRLVKQKKESLIQEGDAL